MNLIAYKPQKNKLVKIVIYLLTAEFEIPITIAKNAFKF